MCVRLVTLTRGKGKSLGQLHVNYILVYFSEKKNCHSSGKYFLFGVSMFKSKLPGQSPPSLHLQVLLILAGTEEGTILWTLTSGHNYQIRCLFYCFNFHQVGYVQVRLPPRRQETRMKKLWSLTLVSDQIMSGYTIVQSFYEKETIYLGQPLFCRFLKEKRFTISNSVKYLRQGQSEHIVYDAFFPIRRQNSHGVYLFLPLNLIIQ